MHATPNAVAPPSAIIQRRQIVLVAAAAVAAFALAFGIGKVLAPGAEATASLERPQAIEVSSASIAAGQPSAGALPGLKDPARKPARQHKAAKPKAITTNTTVTPQQQTTPQQQVVTPRNNTQTTQKPKPNKTITSGGGED